MGSLSGYDSEDELQKGNQSNFAIDSNKVLGVWRTGDIVTGNSMINVTLCPNGYAIVPEDCGVGYSLIPWILKDNQVVLTSLQHLTCHTGVVGDDYGNCHHMDLPAGPFKSCTHEEANWGGAKEYVLLSEDTIQRVFQELMTKPEEETEFTGIMQYPKNCDPKFLPKSKDEFYVLKSIDEKTLVESDIYGVWSRGDRDGSGSPEGMYNSNYSKIYLCPNNYAVINDSMGSYTVWNWKLKEDGVAFTYYKDCSISSERVEEGRLCIKKDIGFNISKIDKSLMVNVLNKKKLSENLKFEIVNRFPKQCDPKFEPILAEDRDDFYF